jgi:hypothetical protein
MRRWGGMGQGMPGQLLDRSTWGRGRSLHPRVCMCVLKHINNGTCSPAPLLQCTLPQLPVGSPNISLSVAGQAGVLSSTSPLSLLVVCRNGFYGRVGESCLACPVGAVCPGFVASVTPGQGGNYSIGTHFYPNPLPFFYNLNGSMASVCPASAVVPGRDVCVVACSPQEACAGGNV